MEVDPRPDEREQPLSATVIERGAAHDRPVRKGRSAWRVLWLLLLLAFCGSLALNVLLFIAAGLSNLTTDSSNKVQEKHFSHERGGRDKVAIISVEGTILSGEGFVKKQIDRATEDSNVKAVVLRVDSPGGTITGSDYIYHHLCEMAAKRKIPIVVSMGGLAASGGYYVSMACGDTPDVVFAEPTTWTGSIGVVIPHYDLSALLKDWGVKEDSIASHPLKTMGSLAKPMTQQEIDIFKALVDESFGRFKSIIRKGRPKFAKDPAALDKLATGQVYTADQALANGLIDKIGFIESAVDRAIELAKLDKDEVEVVEYQREPNLASLLIGGQARQSSFDLAAMFDAAAPRAYYLYTSLPPLLERGK